MTYDFARSQRKNRTLKPRGYTQTIKSIPIDLTQEELQPSQGQVGILRELTTAALIKGHHLKLLSYLLTLINTQDLTVIILFTTIATFTYIVTKTTVKVFNKYKLKKKSANTVMTFSECINLSSILTKRQHKEKIRSQNEK